MKYFRKEPIVLILVNIFLFLFLILFIAGSSSFLSSNEWVEADTVCKYMKKNNSDTILMTSSSFDYPNYHNSARDYLGFGINNDFQEKQFSIVCSVSDNDVEPFAIEGIKKKISFFAMNAYDQSRQYIITKNANVMFGNVVESLKLKSNEIYISKKIADELIGSMNPSPTDYYNLINSNIDVNVSKNKICSNRQFKIIDIIDTFKSEWILKLYGDYVVFGGYVCAEEAVMDNLSIHTIIKDDVYSNAYFFKKAKPLLKDVCGYNIKYNLIHEGTISINSDLQKQIDSNKNNTNVFFGVVLSIVSFGVMLFLSAIKNNYPKLRFNYSFGLLLYFFALLFIIIFDRFVFGPNLIVFSPFGFLLSFIGYCISFFMPKVINNIKFKQIDI